jgi:phosphonate transport system substrate-binding protein
MHRSLKTSTIGVPGIRILRALGLALVLGPGLVSADEAQIEFGLLPVLSTRTILSTYQPLREYLQEKTGQTVTLVTASDYRTFLDRTQRGEYRFVVTAPHFARLAQTEAGYTPMVRLKRELRAMIVVRADSGINSLQDLRGKVISTSDDTAMLTLLGLQYLRSSGLAPGKNATVRSYASVNSAILAVESGESAAAITAQTALNQMPKKTQSALRSIGTSSAVPHMIYIASKQVPPNEVERMTRFLLDFPADKSRGQPFFERTGFQGYVRPTAAELANLDPYVLELKQRLAASK